MPWPPEAGCRWICSFATGSPLYQHERCLLLYTLARGCHPKVHCQPACPRSGLINHAPRDWLEHRGQRRREQLCLQRLRSAVQVLSMGGRHCDTSDPWWGPNPWYASPLHTRGLPALTLLSCARFSCTCSGSAVWQRHVERLRTQATAIAVPTTDSATHATRASLQRDLRRLHCDRWPLCEQPKLSC